MLVYRISDCRFIDDLSGKGAALYGGRWNSKDTHILYTAQSASLALLEAVVHLGKMPRAGFCMATIEIPDKLPSPVKQEVLPPDWCSNPGPDALKQIGDRFISDGRFLALPVPSVVMPEEYNYLLNPAHPLFKSAKLKSIKPLNIDERIIKGSA
ncbi:MAG: RES family NAD+ phosphorylase [Taibaiella sp.]|nr:RES family NAD+ phosphorylase [Taibaiella sp.]